MADFFGKYGPVATVKLIYNHETDEFKGFGFVTMQSAADAHDAADDANGKEFLGARIRCNPARDTRSMRGPERDYRCDTAVNLFTACLRRDSARAL